MLSALPSATWSVLLHVRTVIISWNSWYSCLRCRLQPHPCRFTCGERGCSFPRLPRCVCHSGRVQPELASGSLGLRGCRVARGEAELSTSSSSTKARGSLFQEVPCTSQLPWLAALGWDFGCSLLGTRAVPFRWGSIWVSLCFSVTLKAMSCG